jgi:hypothetical protein
MRKDKRKRSAWDKDKLEGDGGRDEEQDKDKAGDVVTIPELEAEGEQESVDGRTHDGARRMRHEGQE